MTSRDEGREAGTQSNRPKAGWRIGIMPSTTHEIGKMEAMARAVAAEQHDERKAAAVVYPLPKAEGDGAPSGQTADKPDSQISSADTAIS